MGTTAKRWIQILTWSALLAVAFAYYARIDAARLVLNPAPGIDTEDLYILAAVIAPFALQIFPIALLVTLAARGFWIWTLARLGELGAALRGRSTPAA
jgi:hypothetical protein